IFLGCLPPRPPCSIPLAACRHPSGRVPQASRDTARSRVRCPPPAVSETFRLPSTSHSAIKGGAIAATTSDGGGADRHHSSTAHAQLAETVSLGETPWQGSWDTAALVMVTDVLPVMKSLPARSWGTVTVVVPSLALK